MGVEIVQIFQALADADLVDGQSKFMAHRNRDATLGGAIEFSDDQAIKSKSLVELARLLKAVLAGGRIDHQKRGHRHLRALAHHVDHFFELAHEVVGCVQAASRVDEHQLGAQLFGTFDGFVAYARRIAAALARDHLDSGALAPYLKLLDRGGPEGVAAAQQDLLACLGVARGQLADRGGFARAVDANEQDHARQLVEHIDFGLCEACSNLVHQKVKNLPAIRQGLARGNIAQILDDVVGGLSAQIRQNQGFLKFIPEVLVNVRAAIHHDVHALLERSVGGAQAFLDSIEEPHHPSLDAAIAASSFWLMTLVMPSACIDTPYRISADSMVRRWWVIIMSCVSLRTRCK